MDWNTLIYTFSKLLPIVGYKGSHCVHMLECLAKSCKEKGSNPQTINQYQERCKIDCQLMKAHKVVLGRRDG
jgi:hypothetical protein